jgi:methionyl-tRNA formyltransferase
LNGAGEVLRLQSVVLANWGLGREVLKALLEVPEVEVKLVVSRWHEGHPDRWYNVVYDFAIEKNIPVAPEEHFSREELIGYITSEQIDLLVVHAYMRLLSPGVVSASRLGAINIHPSLLPRYRGPSPTYWVLRNKEAVTGLTCHFIDEGYDTGPIIYQVEVPVDEEDTFDSILEKQKAVVRELVERSIRRIIDPEFMPRQQDETRASYAPRPKE